MAEEKLIQKEGFNFRFNPEAYRECQGKCCNGASGNIFVSSKEVKNPRPEEVALICPQRGLVVSVQSFSAVME